MALLAIVNPQGTFLPGQEQLKSLDGWNFTTAALAQPDDEIAANRQRVLVRGPSPGERKTGVPMEKRWMKNGQLEELWRYLQWGPITHGKP